MHSNCQLLSYWAGFLTSNITDYGHPECKNEKIRMNNFLENLGKKLKISTNPVLPRHHFSIS